MATFLLLLIAAMIGIHWFPSVAYPVTAILIVAWLVNQVPDWLKESRRENAHRKQLDDDAPLRQEFYEKRDALRNKYDPEHEWNEATTDRPPEYERELDELHEQYKAVLD